MLGSGPGGAMGSKDRANARATGSARGLAPEKSGGTALLWFNIPQLGS